MREIEVARQLVWGAEQGDHSLWTVRTRISRILGQLLEGSVAVSTHGDRATFHLPVDPTPEQLAAIYSLLEREDAHLIPPPGNAVRFAVQDFYTAVGRQRLTQGLGGRSVTFWYSGSETIFVDIGGSMNNSQKNTLRGNYAGLLTEV